MLSFLDQNILVTGAGSGIGKATALLLGRQKARVVLVDQNENAVYQTSQELSEFGVESIVIVADISNANAVDRMYEVAVDGFKFLNGIVHCAGIGIERTIMDTTREEWDRIVAVNLTGTFFCAQGAAKIMARQKYGRIVLMSSAAGERGGTGRTAYGASKGGVSAITRVMAVELAELGITVNALAPGAIETELVSKMHDIETREAYCSRIPTNRYGTPEEVAATAVFLASREAGYINGIVMPVDGGFMGGGVIKRNANPK
jgi:NAD(P)-dependent dehydrogenase (short-subunit alcohol dehydrogenase family)